MIEDQGLVENHDYRDLRGFERPFFEVIWKDESALLEYEDDLDSDVAAEHFDGNEAWTLGIDPGVASSVVALSILGACPVTSCNGDAGHYEKHPLVYCWCPADKLPLLVGAARAAGVKVKGIGQPGILIYTHGDVSLMRAFAVELIRGIDAHEYRAKKRKHERGTHPVARRRV